MGPQGKGPGAQAGGPRPGQRKGAAPGNAVAKPGQKRRGRRGPQGNVQQPAYPGAARPGKQRMRRGQRAMQSSIRDEREYREPSISSMHAPKPGNPAPRITHKKRRTVDIPNDTPGGGDES